jgi:hypothetical protein
MEEKSFENERVRLHETKSMKVVEDKARNNVS